VLDQVGDGLEGLGTELEQGAEMGAGHAGPADQRQQLDLLGQQARLDRVVVVEEERGREAEGVG
jgi:hypothetical protein